MYTTNINSSENELDSAAAFSTDIRMKFKQKRKKTIYQTPNLQRGIGWLSIFFVLRMPWHLQEYIV